MASLVHTSAYTSLCALVIISFILQSCSCFSPKVLNWSPAGSTWYGSPEGPGSEGGACKYGVAVREAPFSSMVSAGGPSLYQGGKGCGACYEVKYNCHQACSGKPVHVVITDECPGGGCLTESVHFDLRGHAFGALATRGKATQLRNAGILKVQYRRDLCKFPGMTITFKVDAGSNHYYFATVIEFEDGDGTLSCLDLQECTRPGAWHPMERSWGETWKLNSGSPLQGPFSLRMKSSESGKAIIAKNVIPVGWKSGATYRSLVNFKNNEF